MKSGVWGYGGIGVQGYRDSGVSTAPLLHRYPVTRLYPFQP